MMRRIILFAVPLFFFVSFIPASMAAEWYVSPAPTGSDLNPGTAGEPFATIQKGIDMASDGDTVIVEQGIYVENARFKGKNIVLRSTDPDNAGSVANTIIDGNRQGPVVTFAGTEDETCVLSGFTIRNGSAQVGGGILGGNWNDRTLARIDSNTVSGNWAEQHGGGIAHCDGTIENNTVANNSVRWNGGGLASCSGTISNNTISNNHAGQNGGGLYYCNGNIENNIVVGNFVARNGGGLGECDGTIRNNTITGNSAREGSGLWDCHGTIANCIVWGNLAPLGPDLSGFSVSLVTYSCIGGWDGGGIGNLSARPHFVDASAGDYHLQSWSPCIDAGDPGADFFNEPEPNGWRINMGAYGNTPEAASASDDSDGDQLPDDWEMLFFADLSQDAGNDPDGDSRSNLEEYQDGTNPRWGGTWCVDASVAASGDGSSWDEAFKTIQEGIDAAWEEETVIVARGVYVENIRYKGKSIILRSTNPLDPGVVADTVIDGGENDSVVTFVGNETGSCVLSGFTIRHGRAIADEPRNRGGGIRGGYEPCRTGATVENNVVTNNFAWDGGGIVYCGGIVRNNIITDNFAEDDGGGLHRCSGLIKGNRILGNTAGDNGGGIAKCDALIQNNIICNNSATDEGGGLRGCTWFILNNTIVGNTARYGDGLALCEGVIRNCIVWGGTRHGVQLYECSMPTYCCIDRWRRGGMGNILLNPNLVDAANEDYHLQSWSACVDAGDPDSPFLEEPDPSGGRINMGAYGNTVEATSRSPDSDDDQLPDDWEMEVFGELAQSGTDDTDGDELSNLEEYRKGSDPTVMLVPVLWYVKASVPASDNGRSPATPFKTIQEGIDAASEGDTVIVYPGIYFENVRWNGKNIVLRSTDPSNPAIVASTIIDGRELDSVVTFLGSEDERCVLAGFTIRNGSAMDGGGICGGMEEEGNHATIRNNNIVGNSATGYWREEWGQWLRGYGGGIAFCDGIIRNNTISNNDSRAGGGGLYACDANIQNNTIISNATEGDGGAFRDCDGTIENNLITGNTAGSDGGGLNGCDGTVQNNTIVANYTEEDGGGLAHCQGIIRNCIVWGNVANHEGSQIWRSNAPFFCCVQDWAEGGEGNIPFDPGFVNTVSGSYRLRADSPCINMGENYYWFAWPQQDLDGDCRLVGPKVDMGCYEWAATADTDGDLLCDSDEAARHTNPLSEDTDGDGLSDGLEVLRPSDPLAPTLPGVANVPGHFATIQQALCLAVPGDEIIVSPGTYDRNLQFCGTDVALRSSQPDNPDVVAATVLDGREWGPVVSFVGHESPACVLSGFTISNGHADHGAGIRGGNGACRTLATIRNNVIVGNYASTSGAGLAWCDGTIENNTVSNNEAGERGGGLSHCHGTIRSNTIAGNRANWRGGGMHECNGSIESNTITANFGSGLHDCDGTITGNAVTANFGSGLLNCDGRVSNNLVVGNSPNSGAGLSGCDGAILNNLILGNESWGRGGGLYMCNGIVQNNTIAINQALYSGGGLNDCQGTISNCILWGNVASGDHQIFRSSQPTHSCIQDWIEGGQGNTAEHPAFVGTVPGSGQWTEEPTFDNETSQTALVDESASWQPDALAGLIIKPDTYQPRHFLVASNTDTTIWVWGDVTELIHAGDSYVLPDYRLSVNSPCVDAGRNEEWMRAAVDLKGNDRILRGRFSLSVDMGAYEYVSPTPRVLISKADWGIELAWPSEPEASYTVWSCVDLTSGGWIEEATVLSGGDLTWWNDSGWSSIRKFYRIEIE